MTKQNSILYHTFCAYTAYTLQNVISLVMLIKVFISAILRRHKKNAITCGKS